MRILSNKTQSRYNRDFEFAMVLMVSEVKRLMSSGRFLNMRSEDQAEDIVEHMVHLRPDLWQRLSYGPPARMWYYPRESLDMELTPWFMWGGDEYGNIPACFRVPFGGQLCVNLKPRMKQIVENPDGEVRDRPFEVQ